MRLEAYGLDASEQPWRRWAGRNDNKTSGRGMNKNPTKKPTKLGGGIVTGGIGRWEGGRNKPRGGGTKINRRWEDDEKNPTKINRTDYSPTAPSLLLMDELVE